MTSDLTFTVLRLGYLALMWILVLGAVSLLRRDIFGTIVLPRGKGRKDHDARRRESRKDRRNADRKGHISTPHNLLVTSGSLVGTLIPLGSSPIVIGRSHASTLVLEDEYASGSHARLTPDNQGNWWIEDLNSRNGTIVDGERLVDPRQLQMGQTVHIGQTTLELVR
ncbi:MULTISPECIES: FHA domain-containing protein FhaB/FipA [unclassified Schaalia]|uniref:FHA domain-containing protein FhaB/FipA n=1 Tax=unclassified Schaalia TaxID=2691889 RepID=UPI001E3CF0E2|nr:MULTISPECIES: FHA domain-containing protein [unclassified Schaalia]MCD4550020.1 FHA domain-containing protein [Schaalia sp. lx-260]MCD4557912.1 FHA domain-containing protein [Schaalia sp. lx-100]